MSKTIDAAFEAINNLRSKGAKELMKANGLKRGAKDTLDTMLTKLTEHFSTDMAGFKVPGTLHGAGAIDAAVDQAIAKAEAAEERANDAARHSTAAERRRKTLAEKQAAAAANHQALNESYAEEVSRLHARLFKAGIIFDFNTQADCTTIKDWKGGEDLICKGINELQDAVIAAETAKVPTTPTPVAPPKLGIETPRPAALNGQLCLQAKVLADMAQIANEEAHSAERALIELLGADSIDRPAMTTRALVAKEWEVRLLAAACREQEAFEKRKGRRDGSATSERDDRLPEAGTIIERTYKGEAYRVRIEEDGSAVLLADDGSDAAAYKSVSGLAKALTGHPQNGFKWFKLAGGSQLKTAPDFPDANDDSTDEEE